MFLLAATSLPKYHDLKAVFPLKSITLFNTMYFPEVGLPLQIWFYICPFYFSAHFNGFKWLWVTAI